ncbi:MAG: hypothetical protein R3C03_08970 [Pirellulaceae bacterium]
MLTRIVLIALFGGFGIASYWGPKTMRTDTSLAETSAVNASPVAAQDQDKLQENAVPFMHRKLDHAREIVAGLATENFEKIRISAQELNLLSREAQWNVVQTADYVQLSSDFRSSAERLRKAAAEENLDGATLAYFEVTLNCVRCHRYIRDKDE